MRKTKPKLIKCEIRWYGATDGWGLRIGEALSTKTSKNQGMVTKSEYVRWAVGALRDKLAELPGAVEKGLGYSLRICSKDGRYLEERTIPRSLDPRSSRG